MSAQALWHVTMKQHSKWGWLLSWVIIFLIQSRCGIIRKMQINITASNNLTPTRKTLMINVCVCVLCVCVCVCMRACMHAQLRLTFCDPMHYTPPGSSVQGISQARVLEWVAISYCGGGGLFPTQGSDSHILHLLHWQADSLPLCHLEPSYTAGRSTEC